MLRIPASKSSRLRPGRLRGLFADLTSKNKTEGKVPGHTDQRLCQQQIKGALKLRQQAKQPAANKALAPESL